jgi:hypothetical protein
MQRLTRNLIRTHAETGRPGPLSVSFRLSLVGMSFLVSMSSKTQEDERCMSATAETSDHGSSAIDAGSASHASRSLLSATTSIGSGLKENCFTA